jgi:putative phosphoesterase
MRILVVSDSHGDVFSLRCAVEAQPKARMIIFLGDGERDMDDIEDLFENKRVVQVKGNCDYREIPLNCVEMVDGKLIFCTHGNEEYVKGGTVNLKQKAREAKADIVLFGHTHYPENSYDDGLYLFNPGSIREGSYGVVDITKAGIVCIPMKLAF